MAKIKNCENTKCCWRCRGTDHSYIGDENVKWHSYSEKQFSSFFVFCFCFWKKQISDYHATQQLPAQTVIPEKCSHENLYTNVHSSWDQPRCPSAGQLWTNNSGATLPWDPTEQWKGRKYWYMQWLEWISREFCYGKKNPKRLHTIDFIYITFWKDKILGMKDRWVITLG